MAEFTEVCRQWERMCNNNNIHVTCDICAMTVSNNGTGQACNYFAKMHPAEAERIIMAWAEEHPEPIYPTWKEWRDENFPDSDIDHMCPRHFMRHECFGYTCQECINEHIPAGIAAKLGIKPKEAKLCE